MAHKNDQRKNVVAGKDRLSAAAVVERMQQAAGCRTKSALAAYLGTTPQNVSKWLSRNSIPYAEAIQVASRTGVSIGFMLTGQETPAVDAATENLAWLDEGILVPILARLANSGFISLPKAGFSSEHLGEAIANQYEKGISLKAKMVKLMAMDFDTASRAASTALDDIFRDDPITPSGMGLKRRRKASEGYK